MIYFYIYLALGVAFSLLTTIVGWRYFKKGYRTNGLFITALAWVFIAVLWLPCVVWLIRENHRLKALMSKDF